MRQQQAPMKVNVSRRWPTYGLLLLLLACGKGPTRQAPDPLQGYDPSGFGQVSNVLSVYRKMGLIASSPPISFVANVGTFATPSPDSTFIVTSIAIPNRGLTFTKDGNEYSAAYDVTIVVRSPTTEIRRVGGRENVHVATFKETSRTDESIIFRHVMKLSPGQYRVTFAVSDVGSTKANSEDAMIVVPKYEPGMVSRPVVVYEGTPRATLDSAPSYLASPSASETFGVDSTASVYVEAYGSGATPVTVTLADAQGRSLWSDAVSLTSHGTFSAGVVDIPLLRADVGVLTIAVRSAATPTVAGRDTARTTLFLGLGPDLPVVSFDEMVSYLRFFAPPDQLRALREASPETRGAVWAAFLRSGNPGAAKARSDALHDYLERIRDANVRFRGDASEGWLSDRGSVYVGLGEPDATYEEQAYGTYTMNPNSRSKYLIWDFHDLQARIVFVDEFGIGQWKLLNSSASLFRSLLARVTSRQ